jgi:hypothetical protein
MAQWRFLLALWLLLLALWLPLLALRLRWQHRVPDLVGVFARVRRKQRTQFCREHHGLQPVAGPLAPLEFALPVIAAVRRGLI